jgi:hypothetical protein
MCSVTLIDATIRSTAISPRSNWIVGLLEDLPRAGLARLFMPVLW